MDTFQLEQDYIELQRFLQGSRMCQTAAMTWLVYDCLLSLNKEVEYMWKKPWITSTFFYLVLRYLGSACIIFHSAALFLDKPSLAIVSVVRIPSSISWVLSSLKAITVSHFVIPSCRIFLLMEVWPTWIIVSAVQVMLQIRLYLLYQRSKKILVLLVILFLAEVAVELFMCIDFSSTMNISNQPLPGIYLCSSTHSEKYFPAAMCTGLVFESIILCLSIWVSYRRSMGTFLARSRRSRTDLLDILIEGSILYFFGFTFTWVIYITVLSVYGYQWGWAVNAFNGATSIIAGCHLILHLWEAASPVWDTTHQLSGDVIFAYHSATTT